jgi:hypothetical protein
MKHAPPPFVRNEQARALRTRAGNAAVAIRVDTRPKTVAAKKGKGSYRRAAFGDDGAVAERPP